jgi:competence protein ComEA
LKQVLFFVFGVAAAAQSLPDGPGKAVVQRMCTSCHGIENVVRQRRTREGWENIVDNMLSRGATGTDEEVDQVVDYLTAHFGADTQQKINVNKAAAADLTAIGLSGTDANAIVHYRTEKGSIKNLEELEKIPSLDLKKIEALKDKFEF